MLLSLIDRRQNVHSTIIVSQSDPTEWLDQIPIAVAVEAITDRLTANHIKLPFVAINLREQSKKTYLWVTLWSGSRISR